MGADCLKVAKECLDCQRLTAQHYGIHPLKSVTANLPMDGLTMDLARIKSSKSGMIYILVLIDLRTRLSWLCAMPNKASDSITSGQRETLCRLREASPNPDG